MQELTHSSGFSNTMRLKTLLSFIVFHVITSALAELYTAISDIERLVNADSADMILDSIEKYISKEELRLQRLDSLYAFAPDAPSINKNDHIGAALSLFRLQDTYNLNPLDMANGYLAPGLRDHNQLYLSAMDCFELGKIAYLQVPPDDYHAVLWMQGALEKLRMENSHQTATCNETEVLDYLAHSMYRLGNLVHAAYFISKLKQLAPDYPNVDANLEYYLEELAHQKLPLAKTEADLPALKLQRTIDDKIGDTEIYEKLCRRELVKQAATNRKLHCYYKRNDAFLNLAPLKAELVHDNPKIIVFRGAISAKEGETLQNLALRKLQRSEISTTSDSQVAQYRTSKTAWLSDDAHPVVKAISRRVEQMTDLTCKSAESMQVANYGIGGHYMPHYDFAGDDRKHEFAKLGTGDRIATVLFYLAETKAGGATVFPKLGLAVSPDKGDAVFWHNLLKNGQGDKRSRHAACPVLLGVKWIANKWLHEYGQETLRPCSLQKDE